LSERGVKQATKYISTLRQTMPMLAENYSLGKARSEVDENVYSFPHAHHVIYYMKKEESIVIFAVLHKRMIPIKHLSNRGI